jgi:hypothetical protein
MWWKVTIDTSTGIVFSQQTLHKLKDRSFFQAAHQAQRVQSLTGCRHSLLLFHLAIFTFPGLHHKWFCLG